MNRAGHLSIAGATGTGKSSLARALLFTREQTRRLILDPLDEYESSARVLATSRREVHEYLTKRGESDEFSLRYVPDEPEPEAAGYLAAWGMSLGNCVVMVDEAHEAASRTECSPELLRAVKRGRHRGVSAWIISQRPSDIHASLRAELSGTEAWYLRLAEHVDLDILQRRRGKDFAWRVAALPELHALRLTPLEQEPEEYRIRFRDGDYPPELVRIG